MMKKIGLIIIACAALMSCGKCGKIEGLWVQPVPGQPSSMQGINIKEEGKAESINMHTLLYETWERKGSDLILTGSSIGNGQVITFSDTMKIEKLTADSLILDRYGYRMSYGRYKQ